MLITTILVSSSLISIGDFQIEDVLPSEALLASSVENLNHVCGSMITESQREKMYVLINDAFAGGEEIDICSMIESQCKEMMAKAGVSDDWKPIVPAGYAGFGVYPVADYEAGTLGIAMLAVIELNDPELDKILVSMYDNISELSGIQFETVNLAGEDMWMTDSFIDPNLLPEIPLGLGQALSMDRLYMGSVNGYMICGTDPDGVSRAIAATSGDIENDSLASNETYLGMMNQIGQGDLHAVLMMDNIADFIIQADQTHMVGQFLPMLKSAIGDVDGVAQSVTVAPSDDVFLDVSYTIWMPNGRDGLLGIASERASSATAPNFVDEDTVSYSQINVDFPKVVPWFRNLLEDVSAMMPMAPQQQLDDMERSLAQGLAPLGNTVHIVSTLSLPLTEKSMGFLLAVECKDSEEMETFLSSTMPMIGSEPREFLGYRIYPIDQNAGVLTGDMDMGMSMAVGGGWAMLGMTHSVENALRVEADPNSNKSGDTGNAAVSMISMNDATCWGYGDVSQNLHAGTEISELQMSNMIEEMESFDPEMAAEMKAQFDSEMKASKTMNELIASLLGSSAWTMEANDEGFVSHAVLMRP